MPSLGRPPPRQGEFELVQVVVDGLWADAEKVGYLEDGEVRLVEPGDFSLFAGLVRS